MNRYKIAWAFVFLLIGSSSTPSDAAIITLTSGRVVEGTVIQKDADNILILAEYGTTSVPANIVESVKTEANKSPTTRSTNTVSQGNRIPEWKTIVTKLAGQGTLCLWN